MSIQNDPKLYFTNITDANFKGSHDAIFEIHNFGRNCLLLSILKEAKYNNRQIRIC